MKWSEEPRRTGVSGGEVASAWILAGVFMLGLLTWSLNHDVSYRSWETTASIDTKADLFQRAHSTQWRFDPPERISGTDG